jgi:large repetitive protein
VNKIERVRVHLALLHRSILVSALAILLLAAAQLSANVTASPALEIFSAPGKTVVFTITVSSGTALGSFSVLTLGAPKLDYVSVPAGTTCPNVVAGTCTIEVLFQPTAPGRRQGSVVLSDPSGNVLLSVSLDGAGNGAMATFGSVISTFAGGGTGGDGGAATSAQLGSPTSITIDGFGNHYIADQKANKVRKVTPAGIISTFAGTGTAGYSGDGGPATSAELSGPMSVLVDGAGFVYIADTGNNVVRMVDNKGMISTFAGQYYAPGTTPPAVCAAATNSVGDGCPGNQMVLNTPVDLVFCHAQNLHISDKLNNRVRTVMRTNYVTITQVGDGVAGYNGDGELNTSAELNGPTGMAMDAANYIYVADSGNHIIRKTLLTGTTPNPISTVAGTPGSAGNAGDGGPAINAQLNNPHGVQVDPAGDIYIADSDSHVVREVNIATGQIATIAGTGTAGSSGDGGPAASAQLDVPSGLLLDEIGNLYVADSQSAVVRRLDVADAPSLTFTNVVVGSVSSPQNVTVTNLGDLPLTISQITTPSNYSLGGSETSCLSSGETLNPAASCILGIEFAPSAAGNVSGSMVLADNSNPASQTIALTGAALAQNESYTLTSSTPTLSIAAGGNGTATLTLKSSNYVGTVSFAASVSSTNGTPANLTATASSVTLTANGSGNSTVTITANASAANHPPSAPWNGGTVMFCSALLGVPFAFRRKRLLAGLPMVLAISLAGFLTACGGSGNSTHMQGPRTYIVTVTPTGSKPASSVTVTNPSAVSIQVTVQ